jgi:hypothetical protein
MLEVGDCSEDVEKYIAEEEAKLDIVLKGSKTESTVDVSKTTVFDQHTDVFYGKIKESVKAQLDAVKVSVKETSTDSESKKLALENIASGFDKTVSEKVEETKVVVEETAVGVVSGSIAIGTVSDKKDTDVVVVDAKKSDTVIAVVEDKVVANVKVDTKKSEKIEVGIATGSIETEKESVSEAVSEVVEVENDTVAKSDDEVIIKDEADKKHSDKVKIGVAVGVAGAIIGGDVASVAADHHTKKHDADIKKTDFVAAVAESQEGEVIAEADVDTKRSEKVILGVVTGAVDEVIEVVAENDTTTKVVDTKNDSVVTETHDAGVISKDKVDTKVSDKVTVGVATGSLESVGGEKEKVAVADIEKTDVVSAVIVSVEGEVVSKKKIEVSDVKVDIKPVGDSMSDVVEKAKETVNVRGKSTFV